MRLWSIHPKYLDQKGLVALWREGLLARKVLEGRTKGYKNHPQLDRFKKCKDPVAEINEYLVHVWLEADYRGYKFDGSKLYSTPLIYVFGELMTVTQGQMEYEANWLQEKLKNRDKKTFVENVESGIIDQHPNFRIISGEVETWEKVST